MNLRLYRLRFSRFGRFKRRMHRRRLHYLRRILPARAVLTANSVIANPASHFARSSNSSGCLARPVVLALRNEG